jgi:hypothetical protein
MYTLKDSWKHDLFLFLCFLEKNVIRSNIKGVTGCAAAQIEAEGTPLPTKKIKKTTFIQLTTPHTMYIMKSKEGA